jgi:hypothetical protein
MSIWAIGSIEEQPTVRLYNWSIKETNDGNYFVGSEGYGGGRVSTKIVEFDQVKMIGRTISGRIYKLCGDSHYSSEGEYVWQHYKRINNLTEMLPLECSRHYCSEKGPMAEVGADHAGWICDKCYKELTDGEQPL